MDRDNFVTIHLDRVKRGKRQNFKRHVSTAIDIGPYDCDSVMHYQRYAFQKPGAGDTITSANLDACPIIDGPTIGLSLNDIKGLNTIYPKVACNDVPILFKDRDLKHDGGSLVVPSDRRRLKSLAFNDKTSSMCIPQGWSLLVYSKKDYKKHSKKFGPGEYKDLKKYDWNNRISSVKVQGPYAEEIPEECNEKALLFEHDSFQGRRVRVTGNIRKLGSGKYKFNDKTDSLCVPPNTTLHIFTKSKYEGKTSVEIVAGSTPEVMRDLKNNGPGGKNWHDVVSSVKFRKNSP